MPHVAQRGVDCGRSCPQAAAVGQGPAACPSIAIFRIADVRLCSRHDGVRSVLSILAVAVLVGFARTEMPLMSGAATAYEDGKAIEQVTLKRNQLEALTRWLERHQRAWGAHTAEPSTEPVSIWVDLTKVDGKTEQIAVVAAARGRHYLRLSVGPGIQWAYRSLGGILKTRYAQQSINESDLATLRQLLFGQSTP